MGDRYVRAEPPDWYRGSATSGILDTHTGEYAPFAVDPQDSTIAECNEGEDYGFLWEMPPGSQNTVMNRVDQELEDAGLYATTPGSVKRLMRERDEARAEVERLRADIKRVQRPAARVVAAVDMFNDDPASPDTVWNLLLGQVEQLRSAIEFVGPPK